MKSKVLFVCIENSCRSQMAEGFARKHGDGVVEAHSAGSKPSGQVNPRAVQFMKEVGIELSNHSSKGLYDFAKEKWDYVITMGCGDACPFVPSKLKEDWGIKDPKNLPDDEFRTVRSQIETKVKTLIKSIAVVALLISSATLSFAEEEKSTKHRLQNETELSAVSTNGNSKTRSTSGTTKFRYEWEKPYLEVEGGGLGSKNDGVTTAEQYYAGQRLGFSLSKKDSVFQSFHWSKDRFAGINDRFNFQLGYARLLIDRKQFKLDGEGGLGYIAEDRIGSPNKDYPAARLYGKAVYLLSETSDIGADVEYLPSLEEGDNFLINSESYLKARITAVAFLKLSYLIRYNNDPPRGFGKTDTTTRLSLLFKI